MTLALILGVCSLLVSSPDASAAVRGSLIHQSDPIPQDTPSSDSPQNPVPPPADSQPPAGLKPPATHPKTKTSTPSKVAAKKRRPKKKPVAEVAPPADGPKKIVVNNGGVSDHPVQLSPGVSPENASKQQQSTDLLLSSTESNLNALAGRQLKPAQQDMVTQVREYIKQAKAAAASRDLQRAHNLAFKAKLLSDELGKP
jgi:hypothetical protein